MLWLRLVIAHIRTTMVGVMQTPLVGLALPERIVPIGNSSFASDTLHQHQPVHTQQPQNKGHARSTKSGSKRGSVKTTASTTKALIAAGSKSAAPASQPRQPVKQAAKPAKKAASKTKAATKHIQDKAPARTRMVNRSGVNGN